MDRSGLGLFARFSWTGLLLCLGLLISFGLLGAACGGGPDSAGSDPEATVETVVLEALVTAEPTSPSGEEADDQPTTSTIDVEATAEPAPEPALTASFRGVTADSVKVGVTSVDFEQLNSAFGLSLNFVAGEEVVRALIDDLNQRGGVNGRQVEYVFETFLPVGGASADEVCVRLTDDEQVFVVLNGFAGPGAEESNLCITNVGETILIGGRQTAELVGQVDTLWLGRQMRSDRETVAFATLLAESGELDNLGPIAVVALNPAMSSAVDTVADSLVSLGGDVPIRLTLSAPIGDEVAARGEADILIERMRADGITSAVMLGTEAFVPKQLIEVAPEITLLNSDAAAIAEVLRETPGIEAVRFLSAGMTETQMFDHPMVQECLRILLAAYPDTVVIHPDDMTDDDPNWSQAIVQRCQEVRLLEAVLSAAGPNLTNDTMIDAALGLGSFDYPGFDAASIGPDKFDVPDTITLFEWDAAARKGVGGWVAISDTVVVR